MEIAIKGPRAVRFACLARPLLSWKGTGRKRENLAILARRTLLNLLQMQMSGTQIIRLVLLSALLAFLREPAGAATIQAASPSLLDVSTAVAKAAGGDTVSIPAGNSSDSNWRPLILGRAVD